jgi:predicted nucleic acid-binding protein
VTEKTGATPIPVILDSSILTAVARADFGIMTMLQRYDATGQPMVVPVLAITAAALDMRGGDAAELLEGVERLGNAEVADVHGAEQSVALADVIARTDLDPFDAHVAAVADAGVCPILTLNGEKWRQHAGDLDEPLHFIEIADPE